MYPDVDLFCLPSKIFGSLYFVYYHNPHKTKLYSQSLKEIFVSYSKTQKGYSGEFTAENVNGKSTLRFHDQIQVYTRRTTPALVPPLASVPSPAQASSETVTAQLPENYTTDDLLIKLWKGKHTCTQYPLFNFVSYSHLLSFFHSFISSLDSC